MTEQELRELCKEHGVTLRIAVRGGRRAPAYEGVKRVGGKPRGVYLIAAAKLPQTTREFIEQKLTKLSRKEDEPLRRAHSVLEPHREHLQPERTELSMATTPNDTTGDTLAVLKELQAAIALLHQLQTEQAAQYADGIDPLKYYGQQRLIHGIDLALREVDAAIIRCEGVAQ